MGKSQENLEFTELYRRTIKWAESKGIMECGTPQGQAKKTVEEACELDWAIENNDRDGIADGVADVLVTIVIQAEMQGMNILEEWSKVLAILESRTGKMSNGVFVKDK